MQDNGGDSLTLTANGTFTFKTAVTGPTDAYAVTVNTQPTTPNQICTVANGSGTATANVTNVAVTCVLSYTIGGTVTGVVGTGLVLENSSDLEQLPISRRQWQSGFHVQEFCSHWNGVHSDDLRAAEHPGADLRGYTEHGQRNRDRECHHAWWSPARR